MQVALRKGFEAEGTGRDHDPAKQCFVGSEATLGIMSDMMWPSSCSICTAAVLASEGGLAMDMLGRPAATIAFSNSYKYFQTFGRGLGLIAGSGRQQPGGVQIKRPSRL